MSASIRARLAAVETARWALHGALVFAVCGLASDVVSLAIWNSPPQALIACALVSAALGVVLGCLLAPGAALLAALSRRARASRLGGWYWPLVPAALVCIALGRAISPFERKDAGPYLLVIAVTGAAVAATTWLARAEPRHLSQIVLVGIALLAFAADLSVGRYWYIELHEVASVVMIAAVLSATLPLHTLLSRWPPARLGRTLAISMGCALLWLFGVDHALPSWRSLAIADAQSARAYGDVLRALVDFDGDGYSPVLWGGDCDDRDPAFHPGALDLPGGGDRNCNGVDLPKRAEASSRGLLEHAGRPDVPAGDIRRVVLVTLDTFRHDALTPDTMPRLWKRAAAGLRCTRAYAAGSATQISVPLFFEPGAGAENALASLRRAGVSTAAVLHSLGSILGDEATFDRVVHTTSTERTTAAAIEAIEQAAPDGAHLIWVHYYGLHSLPALPDGAAEPAGPVHLPANYREVARILDGSIERVLARLAQPDMRASSIVIVTSDHGEAFGEHGVKMHGTTGYDEVLRVPLVVLGAGIPSCAHHSTVSVRGLPATLLGAFGLSQESARAEVFGRSLLRLRDDCDAPLQRYAYARSARYTSGALTSSSLGVLADDRHKLVLGVQDGLLELYDHKVDPGELVDVSSARPDLVAQRLPVLAALLDLDGHTRAFR